MSSRLTPKSVAGPLAGLVGKYKSWLVARGRSGRSVYVATCALARLSWWMGERGLEAADVSHGVLDAYVAS